MSSMASPPSLESTVEAEIAIEHHPSVSKSADKLTEISENVETPAKVDSLSTMGTCLQCMCRSEQEVGPSVRPIHTSARACPPARPPARPLDRLLLSDQELYASVCP